ncbi:MAG: hypothetical protein L6R41_006576 [Letrouitia leprolyta]|nr:MAG: hypothetical protein L6R41_006576 [Letrouitia leprolyta]
MPSVNTIVPRAASAEFRHQQCRRELWMAKAEIKHASRRVKPQMRKLVAKQKRKLQDSHRQENREQLRTDPEARARNIVTSWEKYVREDQGTTRRAGHAWAVHCFNIDDWGPHPLPSREDFTHLLAHYKSTLKWPRYKMSPAALRLLDYYDTLPLRPNSKELAKARIRMVREMMLLGVLEQEKAKGLQVSAKEERKAKLGLLKQEEGEWMMREMPEDAIFWKVKDIEWQVVESWVGVQGHELPLRKSAGERVEQVIQAHVEVATPVIEVDDDDDGEEEEVSSDKEDEGSEGLYEDDIEPCELEDDDEDVEMT